MADSAVKNMESLRKAREAIAKKCHPAFDELLAYSLERRHLDVPEFKSIFMAEGSEFEGQNLQDHLKENVRLMKIDEISFDSNETIHLPGVESAITSMRGRGHSLVFVVQGDAIKTSVFVGLSKFAEEASDINATLDSYAAAWKANFPGTQLNKLTTDAISEVSYDLADCKEFGVLTGIPSLKREEDSNLFVQGLERLIRAMRGKIYCWISIADPIPHDVIRNSIEACQSLHADIHHLVKTDLSKATSNGKTVMLGMFGMMGQGATDTTGHTDSGGQTITDTETKGGAKTTTTGKTQNNLEGYQRAGAVASPVLGVAGAIIGTIICPGIGTAIGAGLGSMAGGLVNGIGAAVTGKNGYSESESTGITENWSTSKSVANTRGWADTASHAISQQLAGGGFGSFGLTWTKTTTVGQELLNRKAEYVEEVLKAYEERLHEGTALGMWNLGHYFCAADEETYNQGIGIVTSLFTGMDSTYEPPRALKMPEDFRGILRRFNNIYLRFSPFNISVDKIKRNEQTFTDHPLGFIFNGPCTPVNTKELAIATPIATQDVEGVTVSERASFGINTITQPKATASLTVGQIMDKGNLLSQRYRLGLENLPKHLAVFGLTGSGKTNTVHNLLTQLWEKHQIPFMVIEPAKAEYRALAQSDALKNDLLIISAGVDQTSVCPLRLNPFYFDSGKDNDANRVHVLTHIDRLKATFNASFPMYASMPYILEEAILEIYRERGWDLGRSVNRYVDIYKDDFSAYVPTLQDLYLKVDMIVKKKGYFQEQQMNIQAALKARLSSLMVGSKGSMLNTLYSIPAKDLFEKPVVIELENMGDDDEKAFVMGLLVSKLYEYRKTTASKGNVLKHVLVIEEAHRLLANIPDSANMEVANVKGKAVSAFVDMLSEIRAFGQSVFVIDQLPSRVSPNIVKGTGAKIVHRLLAKDDREAVGWTMGMNDDQINDLSLLKTGECVVSQDGDRKSFLCKIAKNELHDIRIGGEISKATIEFKDKHRAFFYSVGDAIDNEDTLFRNDLYTAMLAIGGQNASPDLLNAVKPTEFANYQDLQQYYFVYWTQICREIWGFYGGNYKTYLSLYEAGMKLLYNHQRVSEYKSAFEEYFKTTKTYRQSPGNSLIACAYEQLFLRKDVFATINKHYDLVRHTTDGVVRLAKAIERVLSVLLPSNAKITEANSKMLVEEIISRIPANLSADVVWNNIKHSEGSM